MIVNIHIATLCMFLSRVQITIPLVKFVEYIGPLTLSCKEFCKEFSSVRVPPLLLWAIEPLFSYHMVSITNCIHIVNRDHGTSTDPEPLVFKTENKTST